MDENYFWISDTFAMKVVYKKTFEFLIILSFHSLLNYYLSIIKLFHAKVPKILGLQIFAGGPVNVDSFCWSAKSFHLILTTYWLDCLILLF